MSDNENLRLDRIETTLEGQEQRLDRIETTLEGQGQRLDRIETTLEKLVTQITIYDGKLDAYQKASQQVVNIAFGLLATAALSVIIPAVLGSK